MTDVVPLVRRHRALVSIGLDSMAWLVSYLFVAWLRVDSNSASVPWAEVIVVAVATISIYLGVAAMVRLHVGRAETASLEEMILLGSVLGGSGFVVFVANLFGQWIPRSVPFGAALCTLVIAAWARALWRRLRERDNEQGAGHDAAACVLLVGAGQAGRELAASMLRDRQHQWHPVGFLDDDVQLRHRRYRGIPVLGTTDDLQEQLRATGAKTVVIAIPSASSDVVGRIRLAAREEEVAVKVLPSTTQLLSEHVGIRDLRDINITDVLGRKQLDTDIQGIAGYLSGRRVLVTGAGGSIGSELCRQIHAFGPSELMMLDRDESALHAVQLSIHRRALLDSDEVILCDIRDSDALNEVFASRRPEVVFHAAALKHLPMLEQYPAEAVKTNILGTRNVLRASDLLGVERFVNISTDKAANPTSILGYTKRIAERMTSACAESADGSYLSVRFGNVLGSRGSVLETFAGQIAAGGPLTVTHPDITRYFMTIEEACQLVIQAAAIGEPGEALVLDMGEPVRIVDVAAQLIEQSGELIDIEFTGLRPGEKLHEELFGEAEPQHVRPRHGLVSHVPVLPVSDDEVVALVQIRNHDELKRALGDLCAPVDVSGPGPS